MRKTRTPTTGGNWLLPPTDRCGLGNLDLWQSLNAPLHARHFWDNEITVQSFVNKVPLCESWTPASKRCNPNPTPPPARTWTDKSQHPRLTLLQCPALPLPENSLHSPGLKPTPRKFKTRPEIPHQIPIGSCRTWQIQQRGRGNKSGHNSNARLQPLHKGVVQTYFINRSEKWESKWQTDGMAKGDKQEGGKSI